MCHPACRDATPVRLPSGFPTTNATPVRLPYTLNSPTALIRVPFLLAVNVNFVP